MPAQRERIAWLIFMGLIAAAAVVVPATLTPTARDISFASTLMELRQQVEARYVRDVSADEMREAAIRGMLLALDEHSEYVPPDAAEQFNLDIQGNFHGVGILVDREDEAGGLLVIRPIEDSPAMNAGVKSGDRIVAVNSADVTAMPQDQIIELIKGPVGTPVTLTIERSIGEARSRMDLTMPREQVASPVLEGFVRDEQGMPVFWVLPESPVKLGYIRLTRFTAGSSVKTIQQIQTLHAQGMRGLILDLRSNPGGLLEEAIALADAFIDEGVIVSKRGAHSPEEIARATSAATLSDFPMVILVNELSASASEVLAGALADHGKAVIVGVRTYGKGSVQDVIHLRDEGELKLTTAYYYLPSGRLVHRERESEDWGVNPDVEVKIDYANPQELGDLRKGPPFPRQVRAAVEVLLGLVVAEESGKGEG